MPQVNHAGSFRDLVVYRKAREVSRAIVDLSKSFPKEETYSLSAKLLIVTILIPSKPRLY